VNQTLIENVTFSTLTPSIKITGEVEEKKSFLTKEIGKIAGATPKKDNGVSCV